MRRYAAWEGQGLPRCRYILPRMQEESWRTLGREYVYQSPWCAFRVDEVEIPGGAQIEYGVLESGGFAAVVPVTDGGDVVLVRQWRQPLGCLHAGASERRGRCRREARGGGP